MSTENVLSNEDMIERNSEEVLGEDNDLDEIGDSLIDLIAIFCSGPILTFEFLVVGGIIWYSFSFLLACISVVALMILFIVEKTKPFIAIPISILWGWIGYSISDIFGNHSTIWGVFLFTLAIFLHAPSYIFKVKRRLVSLIE